MTTEKEGTPRGFPGEIDFNLADLSRQKTILIADDDPMCRMGLEQVIKIVSGDKYVLKFANSGEAAIRMVQEEVPSIILTDINFGAGINGF